MIVAVGASAAAGDDAGHDAGRGCAGREVHAMGWRAGFVALLAAGLVGCGGDCLVPGGCSDPPAGVANGGAGAGNAALPAPSASAAGAGQVVLRVTGTAQQVRISYFTPSQSSTVTVPSLPWQLAVSGRQGDFFGLVVANPGQGGDLTAEILSGDRTLRSADLTAAPGTVSIDATCC